MGRMIAWLLDAIVVFVLVRMLFRLFTGSNGSAPKRQAPPRERAERIGGTLVRDPQCGTYVAASTALQVKSGQETFYFCSAECRDAFRQKAS